jgi:hypothetical protein
MSLFGEIVWSDQERSLSERECQVVRRLRGAVLDAIPELLKAFITAHPATMLGTTVPRRHESVIGSGSATVLDIVLSMHVVVLADTHLKVPVEERLPPSLMRELELADLILHAGDITTATTLRSLETFAPVLAVLGNNDVTLEGTLENTLEFAIAGVQIAMIHDSGDRARRPRRMLARFPGASVVVYGHSHVPDDSDGAPGQRLFNPGSATTRRAQPCCTYGILELSDGALTSHRIEALP